MFLREPEMPTTATPTDAAIKELTPTGKLRAGINLSNFLLVTDKSDLSHPKGVAPDMAAAIAKRLGVEVEYVCYESPGLLADAGGENEWDIGLIGADPLRAEKISFTEAYVEIEATYLVPAGSKFQHPKEVDAAGVKIAVSHRSAYDLWLTRNIQDAELVHAQGLDASFDLFVEQKLDALAGLRPKLMEEVEKLPGARILDGRFMAVQQAIGTPKTNPNAGSFLADFAAEAREGGLVASLIEKHGQVGRLTVAGG